jgi:putative tryptophan/tyrosine transport system substrate-binding protein
MPEATRVAILVPAVIPGATSTAKSLEAVAQSLDMTSRVYHTSISELSTVLAGIDERADVLIAAPDHGFTVHRATIIGAAMMLRIPVLCQLPEFVLDGALLSSDPNRAEVHRRLAYYVDALLKGAKPNELPIEEPKKDWNTLNLRAARQLGIDIPGPILMRAEIPRRSRTLRPTHARGHLYVAAIRRL